MTVYSAANNNLSRDIAGLHYLLSLYFHGLILFFPSSNRYK